MNMVSERDRDGEREKKMVCCLSMKEEVFFFLAGKREKEREVSLCKSRGVGATKKGG